MRQMSVMLQWQLFKRKVCNVKKRKWNDNYTAYGFYRTKEEALNPYPSARCLFCTAFFGNSKLTPGHLQRHLKTQHPSHQINQWRSLSHICKII